MPISKTTESRAARKHLRFLVSIGAITADEAKAIRKDVLATLKPAKAEKPATKKTTKPVKAVVPVAKAA